MGERKSLEDLSPFFTKPNAKAIIVTDVKLDDALCLWYFFLLNFSRPAGHSVEIKLFVIGINDLHGGVAMARHIFQQSKAYAKRSRRNSSSVNIECNIFASKAGPPPTPCRHELDTYAPYNNGKDQFPQAKNEQLKFFQDLDAKECGGAADFVGVICQFFMWGVLDRTGPGEIGPTFNADMLDYIVPKSGGMLAFQMGFNTKLSGEEAEQTAFWDALTCKVKAAGAKMMFISNSFSFAKGDTKPGAVDPFSSSFCSTLKQQAPDLWGHLLHAGVLESCLFACDQMAKWIAVKGVEPRNMEPPTKLLAQVEECCKALQLDSSLEPAEVSKALKAIIEQGDEGVAKVLGACTELHSVAEETCGPTGGVDYLNRARLSLGKFGHSVEVTDGQHFMALYQSKVPILQPCCLTWLEAPSCLGPDFDGGHDDGLMWAAKDVDVRQSLEWMEKGLNVPAAFNMTLGQNAPVEMRVTTKKAPSFYISSACRLLKGAEGEEFPPTEVLKISGLGGAVNVAVSVGAAIESKGMGTIENIETDYIIPNAGQANGRAEVQIRITIKRHSEVSS